jgi:hypothetical protein
MPVSGNGRRGEGVGAEVAVGEALRRGELLSVALDLPMVACRVFREQVRRRLRMGQFLLYTRSLWFFCTTMVSR